MDGKKNNKKAMAATDDLLWSASGGLLNQRSINIAERARQARELDDVLRSFDSDEEEDCGGEDGWEAASLGSSWSATSYEAGLAATAKAAAKAAAAAIGSLRGDRMMHAGGSSAEDAASVASTRLDSSEVSSTSVPSTSGGSSVVSYGSGVPMRHTGWRLASLLCALRSLLSVSEDE